MQRNYPRMFLPADDQDKDRFKFRCRKGSTKSWNPETGIRNPESGIQNPESGIQRNPQDSAIRLYKNCLKTMSTQMLYFSIRDTREKNLIKTLFSVNEKWLFSRLKHVKMNAHTVKKSNLMLRFLETRNITYGYVLNYAAKHEWWTSHGNMTNSVVRQLVSICG